MDPIALALVGMGLVSCGAHRTTAVGEDSRSPDIDSDSEAEACDALATALHDSMVDCCDLPAVDLEQRTETLREICVEWETSDRVAVDSSLQADCISALARAWASCVEPSPDLDDLDPSPCLSLTNGLQAEGEPCRWGRSVFGWLAVWPTAWAGLRDVECAPGLGCSGASPSRLDEGVCTPFPAVGEACVEGLPCEDSATCFVPDVGHESAPIARSPKSRVAGVRRRNARKVSSAVISTRCASRAPSPANHARSRTASRTVARTSSA